MIEVMTSIGTDPTTLFMVILASSIVFTLVYKRYIVSAFDPLTFLVVVMIADTALMFSLPWEPRFKWEYAFFTVSVWIGFVMTTRRPRHRTTLEYSKLRLYEMQAVLVLLCAIIVIANLYLGISVGFPLLSSHPSVAKVTSYTGGLGLVRRINMGPYMFLCCGCVYLAAINYKRMLFLMLLLISTGFIALSGGKGAILTLLYAQAMVFAHPGLNLSRRFLKNMNKYMLCTFLAGAAVAVTVTTRDQGSITNGIQEIFRRILLSGDGILYYYPGRERILEAAAHSLIDYWHYLTDGTLTMLRLADFGEPLGSVMMGAGNNGFGPNAQYFLIADLFFGPVWGCLYSVLIGAAIGFFRINYLGTAKTSPIVFVYKLFLAVSAIQLFLEAEMFVSGLAITVLLVSPLWVFARLMMRRAEAPGIQARKKRTLLPTTTS